MMQEYMYHWTLLTKTSSAHPFGPYIMRCSARITDPETIAKHMFTVTKESLDDIQLFTCTRYRFNVSFLPTDYSETHKKEWFTAIQNHFNAFFHSYKKEKLQNKTPT